MEGTGVINFLVHRGDQKDGGDQEVRAGGEFWIVSGQSGKLFKEEPLVLHYVRPDGNYNLWGLHVWGGAACPTDWANPLQPLDFASGEVGVVFE